MPFEEYEGHVVRGGSTRDEVALQMGGVLAIGRNVHKAMGSPGAITMYYDSVNRRVGFTASREGAKNSFKLSARKGSRNQLCASPKSFFDHYEIKIDRAMRFEPRQREGIWCIDLSDPVLIRGEGRTD